MNKVAIDIKVLRNGQTLELLMKFLIGEEKKFYRQKEQVVLIREVQRIPAIIIELIENRKKRVEKIAKLQLTIDKKQLSGELQNQFLFNSETLSYKLSPSLSGLSHYRQFSPVLNQTYKSHNTILNWKFLGLLYLYKFVRRSELTQIINNPFSYLKFLIIGNAYFDNGMMLLLSKAKWPNLMTLSLRHNVRFTADGIKILRKSCSFKLGVFSCLNSIVSQISRRATLIDTLDELSIYSDKPYRQHLTINRGIFMRELVKSGSLMKKYEQCASVEQIKNQIFNASAKLSI